MSFNNQTLIINKKSSEEDHITQDNKSIKYKLKKPELTLLRKGPKFTPTTKGNILNSKSDILNLTRRLQLDDIFHKKEFNEESIVCNKSNKQIKTKDLELEHIVKEIKNIEAEYKSFTFNILNEKPNAMKHLMNNPDIVFKPTDKGGGLVLMDKTYYRDSLVIKGHLDINVYQDVPLDSDKKSLSKVKIIGRKVQK